MKTEIREKEDAGSMEAWSYAQYAGETERERESERNRKLYFKKCTHSMFSTMYICVCSMHTFIQVL